jgi:hypothetical protein
MQSATNRGRESKSKSRFQRKDKCVCGRIRDIGRVLLTKGQEAFCKISGEKTTLVLIAGAFNLPIHPLFVEEGLLALRRVARTTASLAH